MDLSSKKPCNDQPKKRMVAKIGTGGGVGAVIFLGGAFALASAFIVGRKGRSSTVERRGPKLQNDEPDDEPDNESDKEHVQIVLDDKVSSDEVTKEIVECGHVSLVSPQDFKSDAIDVEEPSEKTFVFISPNGQEKRSFSDGSVVKTESSDFLDDQKLLSEPGNVIAEKFSDEILSEREDTDNGTRDGEHNDYGKIEQMSCEEAAEITEMPPRSGGSMEVCCDEDCDEEASVLTEVHKALQELCDEMLEKNNVEAEANVNGDIGDVKCETIDEKESDLVAYEEANQDEEGEVTTAMASASEGVHIDRPEAITDLSKEVNIEDTMETDDSDSHVGDVEETLRPMIDSRASESNNVENDKSLREEVISGSQEVTQENNINEEGLKDHVDEDIAKEQKNETCKVAGLVDEADRVFPQYGLHTEPNQDECSYKSKEENATPENPDLGYHDKNVDILPMPVLEKEMISAEGFKVETDEDAELKVNDKDTISEPAVCQQKDCYEGVEQTIGEEAEAESTNVTMEKSEDGEMGDEVNKMETDDDDDEVHEIDSSELEESSIETQDSSTESNTEHVWPADSLQTMDQEVDRKTLEDKIIAGLKNRSNEITEGRDSVDSQQIKGINIYKSTENSIKKYVMELTSVMDHPGNVKVRMMLIVTLSLLTSYMCSRLFDCSFVKLSLIMFFTMALSRIRSY